MRIQKLMLSTTILLCLFTGIASAATLESNTTSIPATIKISAECLDSTTPVPSQSADNIQIEKITVEPDKSITVECTAGFNLTPKPRQSQSQINSSDIVTTVSANFDYNSTNNMIRINSGSVTWAPKTGYGLRDREFHMGDGTSVWGKTVHAKPTTNSYSTTTNWGWVDYFIASAEAMSGPRVSAFCQGYVVGMESGGSHEFKVIMEIEPT